MIIEHGEIEKKHSWIVTGSFVSRIKSLCDSGLCDNGTKHAAYFTDINTYHFASFAWCMSVRYAYANSYVSASLQFTNEILSVANARPRPQCSSYMLTTTIIIDEIGNPAKLSANFRTKHGTKWNVSTFSTFIDTCICVISRSDLLAFAISVNSSASLQLKLNSS